MYLLRDCSFVVCWFLQKRVSGRRTHFWLYVLSLPKTLHHDFDEVPNRRLQPFIVEDTHVQRLMPVPKRAAADTGEVFCEPVGDESDSHAGGYKTQLLTKQHVLSDA